MSELGDRCVTCQALLDEEDLFCANCGTEAPAPPEVAGEVASPSAERSSVLVATHQFSCQGCGASMSYDASAQTLRCPFCGSTHLERRADRNTIAPRRVVPFAVDRERAVQILRGWLGRGFWRPGDLAAAAAITKMTPVLVPYWVFAARARTFWTADSSQTPAGARGEWMPLTGSHRGEYRGMLIGASAALTPAETASLCPFDLQFAVPPEQVDLDNIVYEPFQVQRKYARPLAQAGLEQQIRSECAQYVPGRARNLKVNVQLDGLTSEPVLLPVWIMAYNYQQQVYRFLLNGQTGQATGEAPTSSWKIAAAIFIAVLVVLMGLLIVGALSR